MDSTRSSTLFPRHTLSVDENTSSQTHRPTQMPPDVGVRPVNANKAFWRDVLFAASAMGNVDIVRSVLAADLASPHSSDPHSGDTALMHAAQHGKAAMVQYLLDAQATVDQTNNDGLTALGLATIARQSQVISTLSRNDAITLSSYDNTRQYTFEQQLRINQAEQALYEVGGRGVRAGQPALMPQNASKQ